MKTLAQLAQELTTKNLVKNSTSKSNINSQIVEVMLGNGPMRRLEDLVSKITILRLQENYPTLNDSNAEDFFGNEDFIKDFLKTNKTCKNGVDTSFAKGQSKSNFINCEYSSKYEIIKINSKTYELIYKESYIELMRIDAKAQLKLIKKTK